MRKQLHFAPAAVAVGCFVFLNASVWAQDQHTDKDKDKNRTGVTDQTKTGASSTDPNRATPTDQNKTTTSSDQTTTTSTTTSTTNPSSSASDLKPADRNFVMKAAQGGMAEVELGKLAQQKASSDDVKNFANRMVEDHQKANDELKQWVGTKSITLPTDLNAKDKATLDRLSALSGPAFDKAYMQFMLKDHKKDVSEFMLPQSLEEDARFRAAVREGIAQADRGEFIEGRRNGCPPGADVAFIKMRIRWTPAAAADLQHISHYLKDPPSPLPTPDHAQTP